jgi:cytoplasmic iron level regulating protein YaaA (DUF328/UPF0246 family)
MLFLLSPAKTLDYETPVPPEVLAAATTPQFVPQSAELIEILKTRTVDDVAQLMDLSEALSSLNVQRFAAWSKRFTRHNSKPAALAFAGDVYDGLNAHTLSADDLAWAQQHVRILSGLYGVLRPLDRMQPYRLEMGTALANPKGPISTLLGRPHGAVPEQAAARPRRRRWSSTWPRRNISRPPTARC